MKKKDLILFIVGSCAILALLVSNFIFFIWQAQELNLAFTAEMYPSNTTAIHYATIRLISTIVWLVISLILFIINLYFAHRIFSSTTFAKLKRSNREIRNNAKKQQQIADLEKQLAELKKDDK